MAVDILHGDCLDVMRGMGDDAFDLCVTDPPYNVDFDYGGHDDAMSKDAYEEWLASRLAQAWRLCRRGIVYFPGKVNLLRQWRVIEKAGLDPDIAGVLGWHKTEFAGDKFHGGPGQCWEPVLWLPRGKREVNPIFGHAGRDFFVLKSHRMETTPLKAQHPCPKPTEVMAWLIGLFCPPGGSVLDPFGGLGTTGLVARRLERSATLIELNAEYVEAARARIRNDAPLFAGEL